MAKNKKVDEKTGTGIWNIGAGTFRGKQQQMQDTLAGKQARTLSSTPAELRTNKPKDRKKKK